MRRIDRGEVPLKRAAVALIDEARCIGCTLCIEACPVDAIVGASRRMHTVIEPWCTGCRLCLPPCPVDCIEMIPLPPGERHWTAADARAAKRRALHRKAQVARRAAALHAHAPAERRKAVAAAIARDRARREARRK